MKKYFALLLASILMLAVSVFAQDGATTLNYYNRTSQTIRMLVNGNPACSGDVMPGGYCVESVNPGTYLMQATNGPQTTAGFSCTVQYGQHCDYTVNEQTSQNFNPVRTINTSAHYIQVQLLNYGPFNADSPIVLTTTGPQPSTTDEGLSFTETTWNGETQNGDFYMIGVGVYPFNVVNTDLQQAIDGFRAGVKGTVTDQKPITVSGQPATVAIIDSRDEKGRVMRFMMLVTYKSNTAYMFIFGTYLDVQGTDMEAVKTFFNSIQLN